MSIKRKQFVVKESVKLCATKQQRNLLLESEITQEFPWLVVLLEAHENISRKFVITLPKDQQIFFEHTLPKLWKEGLAEWVADLTCHDTGAVSTQCCLCNTDNRYMFYITNKRSGRSINVGDNCIYKFDIQNTTGMGRDQVKAHVRSEIQRTKKLTRLNEFYQYYAGGDALIEIGWRNFVLCL